MDKLNIGALRSQGHPHLIHISLICKHGYKPLEKLDAIALVPPTPSYQFHHRLRIGCQRDMHI